MIHCVVGGMCSRAVVNYGGGPAIGIYDCGRHEKTPVVGFPDPGRLLKFVSMENVSVLREFLRSSQLMTHVAEQLLAFLKDVQIDERHFEVIVVALLYAVDVLFAHF